MALLGRNDIDAVVESDTGDDLRQLICSFRSAPGLDAASMSLNTISFAVCGDSNPLVRTVRCRTVANTLSIGLVTGMRCLSANVPLRCSTSWRMVRPSGQRHRSTKCGQADAHDEPRARVSSWPPLRLARLRRERDSVVVVSPAAPVVVRQERCECDG